MLAETRPPSQAKQKKAAYETERRTVCEQHRFDGANTEGGECRNERWPQPNCRLFAAAGWTKGSSDEHASAEVQAKEGHPNGQVLYHGVRAGSPTNEHGEKLPRATHYRHGQLIAGALCAMRLTPRSGRWLSTLKVEQNLGRGAVITSADWAYVVERRACALTPHATQS